MKPLPSSLELPVEGSGRISAGNSSPFTKDHILVSYNWNEASGELSADITITEYPPHVKNLLSQTVTLEEIRIYSGARVESDTSSRIHYQEGGVEPIHLVIRASKRPNIERAITWIRRLLDQAMNLPKFKEKVLIGLENAAPSFDVRGKVVGPGGANLQYITNETGAIVTLRGRGSGFIEPTTGLESIEPLHLCVEHNSKYEVLQAGRQLAFNLIETVQQEWYSYQQQQQQQPQHVQHVPPPPQQSHHGNVVCSSGQLVSVPPPPTTAVPPLLTTSVPPPLIHQPPPQPTHMQLSGLNHLVQGPPPQIQPTQLSQPPPMHQTAQLVQQAHQQGGHLVQASQQAGQMVQGNHAQPGQLVQQSHQTTQLVQQSHQQLIQPGQIIQAGQIVQSAQNQLVEQSQAAQQSLGLVHQGQPTSLLQAQQALGQAMVVPGSGGGVQMLQAPGSGGPGGVQVLQAGQLSTASAAAGLQPQQTLQEIPHKNSDQWLSLQSTPIQVYSTAGGGNTNVLTQQMLAPQTSIIAQQPHIISQASYPLQYIQSAGGGLQAVMYGAAPGGNNAGRDGVMLVQYGSTATRSRIQPQIVQLVHPGTGQVMGSAPFLVQAPHQQMLLHQPPTQVPPGLILQQQTAQAPSSLLLSQHQLQFAAQPQPVQIVSQPPPQTMMVSSSGQGMVTSSVAVAVSSPQVSSQVSLRPLQAQKRRFDQDITVQCVSSPGAVSVSEVSSPHHNKKGVGKTGLFDVGDLMNVVLCRDDASPSKMSRDQVQQSTAQQSNNKLMIAASQSDEADQQQSQRVDMKPDSVKRGRSVHGEVDNEKETKTIYSYGNGKILTTYHQQGVPCLQQSLAQHHVVPPQLQVTTSQGVSLQQALASQQGVPTQQTVTGTSQPVATIGVAAPQGVTPQQGVTVQQGVAGPQGVPQGMAGPPQFTAPPPHYPQQYYQQPHYQTYQASWNHMHNSNNQ